MLHEMKLKEDPFNRIKNGTKTIEFRLYDEKRKQIKIGDTIVFSKLPDLEEKITVSVIELYRNDSFENLFRTIYTDENIVLDMTKRMHEFYTIEQEKQYGVLGIKIKLENN